MKKLALILSAAFLIGCGGTAQSADSTASNTPSAAMVSELPTLSGGNVWTTDYSASTLQFRATHAGETFTGDLNRFAAAIKLDPENPADGEVHVVVDINALDAKDDDRNANLPDKDWFNVASFPFAQYSSTDIRNVSGNDYIADGTLSIKGISRPVSLAFQLTVDGDTAKASGNTTLSRPDFKLGTEASDFANEDWVAFPVEVLFVLTANR